MSILGRLMIIGGIGMISAGSIITTDGSLQWLSYLGIAIIILGAILIKRDNEWLSSSTTNTNYTQLDNKFDATNYNENDNDDDYCYEEEEHYYLDDPNRTEIFPCGIDEWQDSCGNRYIDDGYGNLYEDE